MSKYNKVNKILLFKDKKLFKKIKRSEMKKFNKEKEYCKRKNIRISKNEVFIVIQKEITAKITIKEKAKIKT